MSVWIMTIFLLSTAATAGGDAIVTQEYLTKESCNVALRQIQNAHAQFATPDRVARKSLLITCTEK